MQFIIIPLIITAIAYFIALTRSHTSFIGTRPKKMSTLLTSHSLETVRQAMTKFSDYYRYTVVHRNDLENHIILEDTITWTSFGFFYIIYFTKQPDGKTLIDVGIESKLIQNYGPIPTKMLSSCISGIQNILNKIPHNAEVTNSTMIQKHKAQFCTNCGNKISNESKFCTQCGNEI